MALLQKIAQSILPTINKFLRYGVPSHILSFGNSLGDNLLLTILAKQLINNGHKNIWIKCDYPELFENNTDVKLVLPFNNLLSTHLLTLFGVKTLHPVYTNYNPLTDQDEIPNKHIILKMAQSINLTGTINLKPVLILNSDEEAKGRIAENQIVITTSSSNASVAMHNKEWYTDRYQQIIDTLGNDYNFIQLGSANDAPLNNVVDLRGKTTIRESAAILKNAVLMVSHVGFMMHLARAVDCRSVIIFGGREAPWQSGYSGFKNIYNAVECSPCWLRNTCHYDKKCMYQITTEIVKDSILNELTLSNQPLLVDVAYA